MKYIITESQHDRAIDRFITYQLEPYEVKEFKRYPTSTFWVKDGEVVASVDKERNLFWLHEEIWRSITSMFSLDGIETSHVIKKWLDKHYGVEELSPRIAIGMKTTIWKNIILY
jgi:hypothetical protein